MEDLKKHSSLPSNYVSVVELQQRWLEQQQRKQRETEETQENRNQNDSEKTTKSTSLSIRRRPYRGNRRNQTVRDRRTAEVTAPKSKESQIEAVPVVVDDEQNTEKSKKKMKRNWTKNGKPRVEENLTGGTAQFSPGPVNDPEGKFPVAVNERNGERFRRNGEDRGVHLRVWEQKVREDPNSEIRRKFEDLSLNSGREGKGKSTAEMNGGDRKYNRGFGRFDPRKERDCNLVWVIKGERPDTNVAGIRSSGTRQRLERTRTAQDY